MVNVFCVSALCLYGKHNQRAAIMMIDKNEVPPEIDYTQYWETRDGDLIRYADMTDSHLINAHNMIERQVCDFINRCQTEMKNKNYQNMCNK